jgi:hypothetical protein
MVGAKPVIIQAISIVGELLIHRSLCGEPVLVDEHVEPWVLTDKLRGFCNSHGSCGTRPAVGVHSA